MRDTQKSKLYAAEQVLGKHDVYFKRLADIQSYVDKIVASDWWQERSKYKSVVVLLGRKDSGKAFASRHGRYNGTYYASPYIVLPGPWAATHSVVLHELAHVVHAHSYNEQAHGPEYAKVYIDIVQQFKGSYSARQLRESFEQGGVKIAATSDMADTLAS
jgi:putative metallohydrolase (TIGR04338 family)